jgi:hypothetical protein
MYYNKDSEEVVTSERIKIMAASEISQWMEEEAEYYSNHYEFPVGEMAERALKRFDFDNRPCSEDWVYFMEEKRYKQARAIFKRLKLNMRGDDVD